MLFLAEKFLRWTLSQYGALCSPELPELSLISNVKPMENTLLLSPGLGQGTLFPTGPCTCPISWLNILDWIQYILPRIKYLLLIWDTIITVRKFNEFDSIVLLTYFCIKIDNWQDDNILITNFVSFEPVLQKQFFSNSEQAKWKQKPVFPATGVAVLQICLW
jgi:hypothetical protein